MDIIKQAAAALHEIAAEGIPVQQGWYDESMKQAHVTLLNMGTDPAGHSDDETDVVTGEIQVTIFAPADEVALAERIRKLMVAGGFEWTAGGQDDTLEDSGIFMKPQRFSLTKEE